MSHKDKQQSVFIAKTTATQLCGKLGILDFHKHIHCLLHQRIVGQFIIISLVHQLVESIEESLSISHRFFFMNVWLILAQGFQDGSGNTVA